ncbi:MAG: MBL fold metallo-hydrolase [Bacteroidota bacterium]
MKSKMPDRYVSLAAGLLWTALLLCLCDCSSPQPEGSASSPANPSPLSIEQPTLIVLGIAQDAGYPQADCQKKCCKAVWGQSTAYQKVSCLGLADPVSRRFWIFDATPDFKDQLQYMKQLSSGDNPWTLAGIFLTHAHIGHYTGLMELGREVMGAKAVPVYAMPRMGEFLTQNGPWSQLVDLNNISLQSLTADSVLSLGNGLSVTPFLVPHRDEFSETVGYQISGPQRKSLFIPDIDKWKLWERDIREELVSVDRAFVDGTFFQNGEIPGRDMSEIPHPFVRESLQTFADLSESEKAKVFFIHLNHTNPLLNPQSEASREVTSAGHHIAREGVRFEL